MFSTFPSISECSSHQKVPQTGEQAPTQSPRPKRHQVARACVWCRTYRIKCDAGFPCRNCRIKGRSCSVNKGKDEVRTFPLALKEIERLKERIKELEAQLKENSGGSQTNVRDDPAPSIKPNSLPVNLDPLREHGGNKRYYNWDSIYTQTARSNQQCYGSSSSFYFVGQMASYLDMALQQRHSEHYIQPDSASRCFSSPISVEMNDPSCNHIQSYHTTIEDSLSRSKEEYFLKLFWQSYHCIYPVLDETEFTAHHKSLWETFGTTRKPSALVDIVLAICMQYGAALVPPSHASPDFEDSDNSDATVAGRSFYRSCQSLITDELEGLSTTTVQCHLFSVVWLSNASFHNMAHSVLAMGIRTGIILGLHLEPPEDMNHPQKEFRKRLWWALYALEMKMAMELGRPLAVNISQVTCSIPEDKSEDGPLSAPNSSLPCSNALHVTSFNVQYVKLILATRAIYITFYHKCADILGANGQKSLYQDSEGLEACAEFLLYKAGYLQTWLQQVPNVLKTKRKHSGEPYSTNRSPLDICPASPFWISRQRLFLELLYHNLSMCLYRPFISFTRAPSSCTPLTEGHAISCVNHAITITLIIHQMLTETDFLNGWHEAFHWQWNATLSLIGYILAYPVGTSTPSARKAVSTAIAVFELLSNNFASATSAVIIARDLSAKVDLLIKRFSNSLTIEDSCSPFSLPSSFPSFNEMQDGTGTLDSETMNSSILSRLTDGESAVSQNNLTASSGFAFAFDSLSGLEDIVTDAGNIFDLLDFGGIEDISSETQVQFANWKRRGESC
ncbi:hypothetical protein K469DRAFT_624436 [Zopfia rhizophila CBS 207.26]|uniref:Zn(2)-C6 fungal-type domain-containing protein n=1 Tax=Zopfia rhizophila CBS 207.26 TaxID=1314779 RepID=A0A6A6EE49_9PEZI|nr:hypothetical protein K469DRAFT_624436 [Zopfia rhizophila CBS 207.26]